MNVFGAEMVKLKRSLSWAVVLLLPAILVVSGSVTTLIDGRPLEDGWHTLWLRSVVFYGLFPLAVGIAILASLVWRVEHRGSNWNALMSGPASSLRIVAAKSGVIAMLAAIMQAIALITVIATGKAAFGLPGFLPSKYFAVSAIIIVACIPVAIFQSWLSMVMRSFAAPVAVAFLGAGISALLLVFKLDAVIFLSPYAVVTRATQLGTSTFADTGDMSASIFALLSVAAVDLACILVIVSSVTLECTDART